MRVQHKLTWKECQEFQNQEGMPVLPADIQVGGKSAYVKAKFEDIVVQEDAKLELDFLLMGNNLKQYFEFKSGFYFITETQVTEEEKQTFLKNWFALKGVENWGIAKGDSANMTIRNMGWKLVEDIGQHIAKHLNGEEVQHGAGMHDYYMSQTFSYQYEGPKLHSYILAGGYVFSYMESVDRKVPTFYTREIPTEEQEKEQVEKLKAIEREMYKFLETHEVVFDPMKGVIPLN